MSNPNIKVDLNTIDLTTSETEVRIILDNANVPEDAINSFIKIAQQRGLRPWSTSDNKILINLDPTKTDGKNVNEIVTEIAQEAHIDMNNVGIESDVQKVSLDNEIQISNHKFEHQLDSFLIDQIKKLGDKNILSIQFDFKKDITNIIKSFELIIPTKFLNEPDIYIWFIEELKKIKLTKFTPDDLEKKKFFIDFLGRETFKKLISFETNRFVRAVNGDLRRLDIPSLNRFIEITNLNKDRQLVIGYFKEILINSTDPAVQALIRFLTLPVGQSPIEKGYLTTKIYVDNIQNLKLKNNTVANLNPNKIQLDQLYPMYSFDETKKQNHLKYFRIMSALNLTSNEIINILFDTKLQFRKEEDIKQHLQHFINRVLNNFAESAGWADKNKLLALLSVLILSDELFPNISLKGYIQSLNVTSTISPTQYIDFHIAIYQALKYQNLLIGQLKEQELKDLNTTLELKRNLILESLIKLYLDKFNFQANGDLRNLTDETFSNFFSSIKTLGIPTAQLREKIINHSEFNTKPIFIFLCRPKGQSPIELGKVSFKELFDLISELIQSKGSYTKKIKSIQTILGITLSPEQIKLIFAFSTTIELGIPLNMEVIFDNDLNLLDETSLKAKIEARFDSLVNEEPNQLRMALNFAIAMGDEVYIKHICKTINDFAITDDEKKVLFEELILQINYLDAGFLQETKIDGLDRKKLIKDQIKKTLIQEYFIIEDELFATRGNLRDLPEEEFEQLLKRLYSLENNKKVLSEYLSQINPKSYLLKFLLTPQDKNQIESGHIILNDIYIQVHWITNLNIAEAIGAQPSPYSPNPIEIMNSQTFGYLTNPRDTENIRTNLIAELQKYYIACFPDAMGEEVRAYSQLLAFLGYFIETKENIISLLFDSHLTLRSLSELQTEIQSIDRKSFDLQQNTKNNLKRQNPPLFQLGQNIIELIISDGQNPAVLSLLSSLNLQQQDFTKGNRDYMLLSLLAKKVSENPTLIDLISNNNLLKIQRQLSTTTTQLNQSDDYSTINSTLGRIDKNGSIGSLLDEYTNNFKRFSQNKYNNKAIYLSVRYVKSFLKTKYSLELSAGEYSDDQISNILKVFSSELQNPGNEREAKHLQNLIGYFTDSIAEPNNKNKGKALALKFIFDLIQIEKKRDVEIATLKEPELSKIYGVNVAEDTLITDLPRFSEFADNSFGELDEADIKVIRQDLEYQKFKIRIIREFEEVYSASNTAERQNRIYRMKYTFQNPKYKKLVATLLDYYDTKRNGGDPKSLIALAEKNIERDMLLLNGVSNTKTKNIIEYKGKTKQQDMPQIIKNAAENSARQLERNVFFDEEFSTTELNGIAANTLNTALNQIQITVAEQLSTNINEDKIKTNLNELKQKAGSNFAIIALIDSISLNWATYTQGNLEKMLLIYEICKLFLSLDLEFVTSVDFETILEYIYNKEYSTLSIQDFVSKKDLQTAVINFAKSLVTREITLTRKLVKAQANLMGTEIKLADFARDEKFNETRLGKLIINSGLALVSLSIFIPTINSVATLGTTLGTILTDRVIKNHYKNKKERLEVQIANLNDALVGSQEVIRKKTAGILDIQKSAEIIGGIQIKLDEVKAAFNKAKGTKAFRERLNRKSINEEFEKLQSLVNDIFTLFANADGTQQRKILEQKLSVLQQRYNDLIANFQLTGTIIGNSQLRERLSRLERVENKDIKLNAA